MIDKGRCLPWAHATPCIMCEEVCPTPKKAIWFEKVRVRDRKGKVLTLQQPHVDLELCIGCGICEAKCPVLGRPAIYCLERGGEQVEGEPAAVDLIVKKRNVLIASKKRNTSSGKIS